MKKWIKYITSTVIFSIIYIIAEYLLIKNINWKMAITATIIYFILYAISDLTLNKSKKIINWQEKL
mgnify:FL=1